MNTDLRTHVIQMMKDNLRLDGRNNLDYRDVSVRYKASKNAEGSAWVKIGDTEVIAGVKMELGTPYPDKPDEGTIMVGVELLPLSNPDFESGPPSIQAIELARVTDRAIRESGALDFKKLCITPGEKAWIVVIDICPINDCGNLFDACSLAALAALRDARFPEIKDDMINYKKLTDQKIELGDEPLTVTVIKIGDTFFVDPIYEEEQVIDARLSVGVNKKGELCSLQKGGDYPLTDEDIIKMVDIAIEKTTELRKLL